MLQQRLGSSKGDIVSNEPFLRSSLPVGALAVAIAFAPLIANAAVDSTITKPERNILDPLGVDIADGLYVREDTFLTIGDPATGGLSWRYIPGSYSYYGNVLEYTSGSSKTTTVKLEGNTTVFILSGSTYLNASGTGATLTKTSTNYIYTADDGTIYTFNWAAHPSTPNSPAYNQGTLLTIQRPNGLLTTLVGGVANNHPTAVINNTGSGLKLVAGYGTVYAVNALVHSCDASLNCNAYDNSISTQSVYNASAPLGVTGTGYVDQVTDSLGNNIQYFVNYTNDVVDRNGNETFGAKALWFYQDALGHSTTVNYDGAARITTFVDPRGTYSFSYNGQTEAQAISDFNRNVTVKDPGGATIYSAYAQYKHSTISWQKEALGNQTSYNFATYSVVVSGVGSNNYTRLLSETHPEGDSVSYGYDSRGNVTSVTHTPKSGSGLSATTITASYPSTCASLITCNKPTWTKDALGNETDYTYDGTHGGVLTVTLPADQNGLRRRTYNTYTAFDTGNGLIYRLTRTETCGLSSSQLSLTACPAASSTSVTTTDYGNASTAPYTYKSFQPYAVTQTDGAGSVSATTTYGYDVIGNVVMVDGPRTDVDDRSYRTYDANRRVIYEIGVLPGGSGSPHRTVIHHVYDGAGRELRTETGYASSDATNGSDFVVTSFKRMTYDAAGRLVKTELVQP